MIKKLIITFIKIILISLPIIFLWTYWSLTFWGEIYVLDVNNTNRSAILEALQKDNIKFDDLSNVARIRVTGAGLNNYTNLQFWDENNNSLFNDDLNDNEHYYIKDYLIDNNFNIDYLFFTTIIISLSTIIISIFKNNKATKYNYK